MLQDDSPLVSVLIPLYNHERYIVKCLESVFEDDYSNKELIVIDDGSSDSSFELVTGWHSANQQRFPGRFEIMSRPNKGVSKTLNELLSRARGEFIAFLSSDDYLLPGGIMARVEYLRHHPEKMLVVGDFKAIDESGELIKDNGVSTMFRGVRNYLVDEKLVNYEMVFHWCLAGPVYMGRKGLYDIVGYDETLSVEDWAFCLPVAARNLLGFVDSQVAAYRVHKTGKVDNLKFNRSMLKTVEDNIPRYSGLRKLYLFAEKLKLIGVLARLEKEKHISGFLCRKAGRILIIITKLVYSLYAKIVCANRSK